MPCSQNTHKSANISKEKRFSFARIQELDSTYYQGVFSPEQGSLRQLDRAEPEVVAKSATLQERGPGLETKITDRGNIEPAS